MLKFSFKMTIYLGFNRKVSILGIQSKYIRIGGFKSTNIAFKITFLYIIKLNDFKNQRMNLI